MKTRTVKQIKEACESVGAPYFVTVEIRGRDGSRRLTADYACSEAWARKVKDIALANSRTRMSRNPTHD